MIVSTTVFEKSGRPGVDRANKTSKKLIKNQRRRRHVVEGTGNPLYSEILEWLQECRENLVDDEIPLQGGSHASISHEMSLEPTFKKLEDFCKYSVYIHYLKDRNFEICKRTKIIRSSCRRCNSGAVPDAEIFW